MGESSNYEQGDLAKSVREALVGLTKRGDQVAAIVKLINSLSDLEDFYEAFPHSTFVEVERVEAYGLEIGLDANGDACRIAFPYGACA